MRRREGGWKKGKKNAHGIKIPTERIENKKEKKKAGSQELGTPGKYKNEEEEELQRFYRMVVVNYAPSCLFLALLFVFLNPLPTYFPLAL